MGEDITSDFTFFTLNQFDVCLHTLLCERFGKLVVDVRVGMKTGKLGLGQLNVLKRVVEL